jgi:hypothetical protein
MKKPFWDRAHRCVDGRVMRHDPQHDDPYLETDIGECDDCDGKGCDVICETCVDGEIDERLGGIATSGIVKCPDCQMPGLPTCKDAFA